MQNLTFYKIDYTKKFPTTDYFFIYTSLKIYTYYAK